MYEYTNSKQFVADYKRGKISFPFVRMYYTDDDIKEIFQSLKEVKFNDRIISPKYKIRNINMDPKKLLYQGEPRIILSKSDDYEKYTILSDMFNEENRIKCRFFSARSSPEVYYKKNIQSLAQNTLKNYSVITPKNLRLELYYTLKDCAQFKPTVLLYLIKLFKCKSVLDPCSGWGDRLITCMAADIRYVGVDPNYLLHPKYQEMIEFFMPKSKRSRYTMINGKIQHVKLPDEEFDLVFTSPPYFKIEQYSNAGEVMEKTEHEWFNKFLVVLIDKTCKKLKNGGHLALAINQLSKDQYINKMLKYVRGKKNMKYLGVMSYSNKRLVNPQPIWVWEKNIK